MIEELNQLTPTGLAGLIALLLFIGFTLWLSHKSFKR